MNTKKEPVLTDPTHINNITEKAKKLRHVSKDVLAMFGGDTSIYDVNVIGTELEFLMDNLEEFYKESEGCHVYLERNDDEELPFKAFFRLYNTRFAIKLSDLTLFKRLFSPDEYTSFINKDFYSMTVEQLVKMGAHVNVSFHFGKSRKDAQSQIDQFDQFGAIDYFNTDQSNWIVMSDEHVSLFSFYSKGGQKNEAK